MDLEKEKVRAETFLIFNITLPFFFFMLGSFPSFYVGEKKVVQNIRPTNQNLSESRK